MVLLPFLFLLAAASKDGAITKNSNIKQSLNVMLMEADLLTSEACEQVRRASMFPTSVEYMGYWFCFESVLGKELTSFFQSRLPCKILGNGIATQ